VACHAYYIQCYDDCVITIYTEMQETGKNNSLQANIDEEAVKAWR